MIYNSVKYTFASRLKFLREEKGISQAELADKLGVSRGSISFYENAERTPDIEFLHETSYFFNAPVEYLLGYTENREYTNDFKLSDLNLSDKAISLLASDPDDSFSKFVGLMIEHEKFGVLVDYILNTLSSAKFEAILLEDYAINKAANDFLFYKMALELSSILKDCLKQFVLSGWFSTYDKDKHMAKLIECNETNPYDLNMLFNIITTTNNSLSDEDELTFGLYELNKILRKGRKD